MQLSCHILWIWRCFLKCMSQWAKLNKSQSWKKSHENFSRIENAGNMSFFLLVISRRGINQYIQCCIIQWVSISGNGNWKSTVPRRNKIHQGAFARDSIHTLTAYLPTKHKNKRCFNRLISQNSKIIFLLSSHFWFMRDLHGLWHQTGNHWILKHQFFGDIAL